LGQLPPVAIDQPLITLASGLIRFDWSRDTYAPVCAAAHRYQCKSTMQLR